MFDHFHESNLADIFVSMDNDTITIRLHLTAQYFISIAVADWLTKCSLLDSEAIKELSVMYVSILCIDQKSPKLFLNSSFINCKQFINFFRITFINFNFQIKYFKISFDIFQAAFAGSQRFDDSKLSSHCHHFWHLFSDRK